MQRTKLADQWYEFRLPHGNRAGVRCHGGTVWGYYFRSPSEQAIGAQEYRVSSYRKALNKIKEFVQMDNNNKPSKPIRRLGEPGGLHTFQYLAQTADGTKTIIYAEDMSEALDEWLADAAKTGGTPEPHSIRQMADNE